ncbi:phage tail length tape measure family protein [Shinella sp. G-2]|uniref:phage tail length tape measure family protein n=1 Tax=Shinella sp. G-2 TaxID=3133141 RepID=UPI003D02F456
MATAPLKIAARIELDGTATAVANVGAVGKAISGIGTEAATSTTKLQQLINASAGLHSGAVNDNARRWSGVLADEALSLDRLRAKYNPLFAVVTQYKQAQVEIRTAHAMGAISTEEMTAALSRQRQVALASMDVIKGRSAAMAQEAAAAVALAARTEQLRARFDPLAAAGQRYRQTLLDIAEAERLGALSASQAIDVRLRATAAYNAEISQLERLSTARKAAAQSLVDQRSITPDRASDIDAYARSLDQIRAKFNPVYAAITQYKQAQLEIRQAHAVGAISSDEMTAALSRQRQMTLSSIDAIKGRNRALADTPSVAAGGAGLHGFQSANLAFQAQDIAVTAAMGMSPLMIGLQQGTQIASVISSMERPVAGLVAGFRSLVSLSSLFSVGLTAGVAAAIQYFMTAEAGAENVSELLEEQNGIIRRAAAFWGEATPALKRYVDELERAQQASDAQEAGGILAGRELEGMGAKLDALRDKAVLAFSVLRATPGADDTTRALAYAWDELREKVAAGTATVADFNNAKAVLADAVRTQASPAMLDFSKSVDEVTAAFYRSLSAAQGARAQWIAAVAGGTNVQDIVSGATFRDKDGEIVQTDSRQPKGVIPVPTNRPLIELDGLPGADKIARGAASARNAYRDLIKSADDRVAQMKLEAELAGMVGIEADALRFRLDLLQQSEDKGRSITEAQRAAIAKRVDAFKEYAEAASTAKLKADLLWESEQAGRTWMDQQIAGRLRASGKAVDFDSVEADMIRMNLSLQSARDYAGDFAHTLFDGLDQGKGLFDSFADAGISAFKRLGRSLLDDFLNNLFKAPGAGGSGGGSFLGSIFGGLFSQWGAASAGLLKPGLFYGGGYTGDGGLHEPRGIVHAGEVVWSQRDVARAGGVGVVEAMRLGLAGYAGGGAVDVQPMLPIGRSADQIAQASTMAIGQLKILLGISSDGALNLRPEVMAAIEERAPGIALEVVEQNEVYLPEKIAAYNENPNWRTR